MRVDFWWDRGELLGEPQPTCIVNYRPCRHLRQAGINTFSLKVDG